MLVVCGGHDQLKCGEDDGGVFHHVSEKFVGGFIRTKSSVVSKLVSFLN